MTRSTSTARRWIRRLAPLLGLLLVTVLFVSGTHQHADGTHRVCAMCTVADSPAVAASLAAPSHGPSSPPQAVHAPLRCAPLTPRLETSRSRAPPLA